MGSEDLHHKRKQRTRESFKREILNRDTYDVVLIVCEGEKTEPYYLRAFRDDLRLNSANIKVVGVGADPLKIVEYALKKFNETKDYDRVFCVFDKDQHTNYQNALSRIKALNEKTKKAIPIYGITSVPCFEYWILLHFIDSSRPYSGTGRDIISNEIRKYIKDYHKGHKNIYELTKCNLSIAINRAKKIFAQQKENGTDNPSTNVYELIEYLSNIKKKK